MMPPLLARGSKPVLAALLVLLAPGCIESSQQAVDYDAFAVPDPDPNGTAGAWTIRLTRAELAFGPAYFCAASSGSSTLCAASIAELASISRIDALAPDPQPLGRVHGFTGAIHSASYDFGITWFDTQNDPAPAEETLDGHSLHLEGEAQRDEIVLPFIADVDLTPQYQGQTAVPTAPAEALVDSSSWQLELHFRAATWFGQLDLDQLAAQAASPARIMPGSPEHNALLVGVKNLSPPEFRWVPIQTEE
jgi:hypothetical protein